MTNHTKIITIDGDEWKLEIDSEGVYLRTIDLRPDQPEKTILFRLEMLDQINREYLGYLVKKRNEEKAIAAIIKDPANDVPASTMEPPNPPSAA